MATTVTELENTTAGQNENGEWLFQRNFLVVYDEAQTFDGSRTSMLEIGIPPIGSSYPFGFSGTNERPPVVISKNSQVIENKNTHWLVTVNYGFAELNQDFTSSPWSRGPVYNISSLATFDVATKNYIDGNVDPDVKPVANSVGDPIRTLEIQIPRMQIVANVAETSLNTDRIAEFLGKINSSSMNFPSFPGSDPSLGPKTVRFQSFSASEQVWNGQSYWQSAYTFIVNFETWVGEFRNEGPNYYVIADTPSSKKAITLYGKAVEGDLNLDGTLKKGVDANGKAIIDRSNPVYIQVQVEETRNLNLLI